LFSYEAQIHYVGGGACSSNPEEGWSVQEGRTDCWGVERFFSNWSLERFLQNENISLRKREGKKCIVESDVD